ncbi:MAG: type II toxin-antitoxin system Phd/YefM family antitoxin [Rhodoferax sp.]|jgi:prevent-host-death family protein|uniref:type II toxin-antitoxin system Phd/YefM family antitoxin n=1 Tax=Rhodoferax sp. TaxID=50421 RepID=UPI001B6A589C|nr:type II toxin-antitoxin system Phd/YefM family antitoxin [Rhodoferax sp.]MBP8191794.1 type II toxin-antitoxin system Phd/YefM family antitoxin [Aquabacterium sp.]MBP9149352.1 type II toxin-antitoxin system Phd/YefM family antitoxin [Rhodoferax sp.]MBP9736801.1 type II toxin-antitoxin system Phd/YefM family antitoxin [Rhodoferax sp.]
MQTWQMQTAKARFSDLVRSAKQDGPQDITVHGRSVAVVMSRELFDRLSGNAQSLVAFIQQSPLSDSDDLVFERDTSLPRAIAL